MTRGLQAWWNTGRCLIRNNWIYHSPKLQAPEIWKPGGSETGMGNKKQGTWVFFPPQALTKYTDKEGYFKSQTTKIFIKHLTLQHNLVGREKKTEI